MMHQLSAMIVPELFLTAVASSNKQGVSKSIHFLVKRRVFVAIHY